MEHIMPIFEYRCTECEHVSEFVEKFDQPPQTTCPHCHAQALKKLISAGNFHLKGSGWYVTDFKDKDKGKDKDTQQKPSQAPSQTTPSEASANKAGNSTSLSESKASNTKSQSTSKDKEK